MSAYTSVTGAELARILCGDGWLPIGLDMLPAAIVLRKEAGNAKPISITLSYPIGKGRVEKICRKAGISAAQFEQLFLNAAEPEWLDSTSSLSPNPEPPIVP